jgi:hypothetical protein
LNHCDQVQPEQGKIVQVVLGDRLAAEVGVDETKSAKPACASAESADIRKLEARGVPKNDVADEAVARQEDTNLASKLD